MQAVEKSLKDLLGTLPRPVRKDSLDTAVSKAINSVDPQKSSPENRRIQWEYVLRNEVFDIAVQEGAALKDPDTSYYHDLRDILDIVLTFTEHDACEQIFPFNVLYDLLETQTVTSCSHIFSWIEERADRLTEGMVPQKGKALVLLRTLNDLLRRLSKMGSTTKFCGRILTFLSRVFPLGERSGVNLRGEYGPVWEGPGADRWEKPESTKPKPSPPKVEEDKDKMQVDEIKPESAVKEEAKDDFYHLFWSLQLPFSKPPIFAEPHVLSKFKEVVNKVLPVIKEATAKERALMGSKTSGSSLKRKREPEVIRDPNSQDYFFARYLTSPELLELEVADTHFRRQFLFQLLILLQHLLTFTKSAKAEWSSPRNRSLQIDFTLESEDAQWVEDTIKRASEELRQTAPNGRQFAETIQTILEREKNWIKWKNELCNAFDRDAWSTEVETEDEQGRRVKRRIGLQEATFPVREKMREDPPDWPYRYGSAALTEIWELGFRDLRDLERPFLPGELKDFVKKVKQEDARIEMRRKQLAKQAERIAAQKAALAAAAKKEEKEAEEAAQATKTPPPSAPRTLPAPTTPLQHPLPAKPGTASRAPQEAAAPSPAPTPAPAAASADDEAKTEEKEEEEKKKKPPEDPLVLQYEENKLRWAWLALRTARDLYFPLLGKIDIGDIVLLQEEVENAAKAAKEREERIKRGEPPIPAEAERGTSPGIIIAASLGSLPEENGKTGDESQVTQDEGPRTNGHDTEDMGMEASQETVSSS